MQTCHSTAELHATTKAWRERSESIALVPTMGNLHAGHLELVKAARNHAQRVVVSIFVNPTQFGPDEDLASYPRTLQADLEALASTGADLVFLPDVEEVYPDGEQGRVVVDVPALSGELCGQSRPVHFSGVATVVTILLNLVLPDVALFGQKDYQQLKVIEQLVTGLRLPVSIVGVPTHRESDGLAMSSRNGYLDEAERGRAPVLYRTLCQISRELQSGHQDFQALETDAAQMLQDAGFIPDYVSIRREIDLKFPEDDDVELVVFAAAQLGKARLIDNVLVRLG